ncbi:hypothetical protein TNCV_4531801 [Trichonephila clavipes]|nr:hypothetical protein TNCV_4531801 [Trichonephila clavipes]
MGKDTVLKGTLGLYGEGVVKSLLDELSGQGYHLYIDRFFMSPSLADELFGLQTNTCGTVLSTMHDAKLLDTGKKDRKTSNPLMKPEYVVEYPTKIWEGYT